MSQIFISYRREGGEIMAQLLYDKLVARGYTVFYDVESLKGGRFDSKLLEEIERAEDFVLILPPHGLDRCISEGDWVHQEIKRAMDCRKNIIPVMLRGFTFPDDLPDDIKDISRYNGVNFGTMEFFDAKVRKIVERLKSVSPLGDQATEKESAAVSGYESFRQRLMAECEELLETVQHHWSKLYADSAMLSPIEAPVDRAQIRVLIADVEKWKEKKSDFEQKANSSIDIYATAYMQEVFHRLEEQARQVAPLEEALQHYAFLFEAEEIIYAFKINSRLDYNTLQELKEKLDALPETVRGEMRPQASEALEKLWKSYSSQLTFERGGELLAQMFLNLSLDLEKEEIPTFSLEDLATVRADIEMAQNILTRFDTLCAQCNLGEDAESPIFTEAYAEHIEKIPLLKKFVAEGLVFIAAGNLCEDIGKLDAESAIKSEAVRALIARRDALSEAEAAYMSSASLETLAKLETYLETTERLASDAEELYAQKHGEESVLVEVEYTFDQYEVAKERALAIEKWASGCLSLALERAKLPEKRILTAQASQRIDTLKAEAEQLFSDPGRIRSQDVCAAYSLETRLRAMQEGDVFDPETVSSLEEGWKGLPTRVQEMLSSDVVTRFEEENTVFSCYRNVNLLLEWLAENYASPNFENHKIIEKLVEKAEQLQKDVEQLKSGTVLLSERYKEVRLPMEEIEASTQRAKDFVEKTVSFFSCYEIYEWMLSHKDIEEAVKEDLGALKTFVGRFRAAKKECAQYDLHGDAVRYYAEAINTLRQNGRKQRKKIFFKYIAPLLTLVLLIPMISFELAFRESLLEREDQACLLMIGICIVSVLHLVSAYKAIKRHTFILVLPAVGLTAYGLILAFPRYFYAFGFEFWYVLPAAGWFVAAILFASLLIKGTAILRAAGIIFVLICVFTPFVAALYPAVAPVWEEYMKVGGEFFELVQEFPQDIFLDGLSEGLLWFVSLFIGGGFWNDELVHTALTNFTLLFYFSVIARLVCRRIRKARLLRKACDAQLEKDDALSEMEK